MNKWYLVLFFSVLVGSVWLISTFAIPHKGILLLASNTLKGGLLCLVVSLAAFLLGFRFPITPFTTFMTGLLGIPGLAFSAFLSLIP